MVRGLLLLLLLFILPINAFAAESDTRQAWDDFASKVLEFGKQEEFERAKAMLEKFEEVFPGEENTEMTITEMRIVLNTHNRALHSVTATDQETEQRMKALTEFRLAVDALVTEEQPIWRQTDDKMLGLIDEMKAAVAHRDYKVYERDLQQFLGSYSVIRPALGIDLSTEMQQRLDSHIAFFENYGSSHKKDLSKQLETMKSDFKEVYEGHVEKNESSIVWMIISIGGIITVTLLYVLYRKYRGEKTDVKKYKQFEKD
ncbi:sporulation protein YpjB [Alkalihalobacillus sp. CinArs1]|uniref:sporulation protein YpjB n=1 Tax=Alkalihalobacillus sp. CinArs1 TaxID=2995314 RepID=UPI0022DE867A|nr:sporulation protein YpjB [Alkalihalobacillus sp. CinArs1]